MTMKTNDIFQDNRSEDFVLSINEMLNIRGGDGEGNGEGGNTIEPDPII